MTTSLHLLHPATLSLRTDHPQTSTNSPQAIASPLLWMVHDNSARGPTSSFTTHCQPKHKSVVASRNYPQIAVLHLRLVQTYFQVEKRNSNLWNLPQSAMASAWRLLLESLFYFEPSSLHALVLIYLLSPDPLLCASFDVLLQWDWGVAETRSNLLLLRKQNAHVLMQSCHDWSTLQSHQ